MKSMSFFFPFSCFLASGLIFFSQSVDFSSISWIFFLGDYSLEMMIVVDFLSFCFFMTVSLVSVSVLVYSDSYMEGSLFKKKFMISMMIFILSMMILSFSADLFWVMIGWDGLGLSSFFLIVFFQNWKSLNSSMITFMTNRLGDCCLLISLSWVVCMDSFSWVDANPSSPFLLLIIAGAFSKSAQIPFSAWLPLAMAAPTPVSSLVHSSTLVTAGVYLSIRFSKYFNHFSQIALLLSFLTIFLAGSSSLGELDAKKIVAFSTLSHISLMIMISSLGMSEGALLHMMTHALFKSLLFMIVGVLIHSNSNFQDIRKLSLSKTSFPVGVAFLVSLLSMTGIPFLAGFISKEILFDLVSCSSWMTLTFFFIAVLFTSSYSFRMMYFFLSNIQISSHSPWSSKDWKVFFFMGSFCLFGGSVFSSMGFQNLKTSFFYFDSKIFLFSVLFMGVLVGLFVCVSKIFSSFLILLQNMWFIFSFSTFYQSKLVRASWFFLFKNDSKGSLDYFVMNWGKVSNNLSKALLSLVFDPLLVMEELVLIVFVFLFFF